MSTTSTAGHVGRTTRHLHMGGEWTLAKMFQHHAISWFGIHHSLGNQTRIQFWGEISSKRLLPNTLQIHLSGHLIFHSDENLYQCKLCNKSSVDLYEVVIHAERAHSYKRQLSLDSEEEVRLAESQNLQEKYRMISCLRSCDDPIL